jgi:hypothetical protein
LVTFNASSPRQADYGRYYNITPWHASLAAHPIAKLA